MQYDFLTIEGNIGSGKTSLSKMLAEQYNTDLLLEEFAENPFLPDFYKNPDRYAFQLELFFMAGRYEQMKERLLNRDLFGQKIISDYLFSKSLLFASVTLKSQEYKLYRKLFSIIYSSLPLPGISIYLWNDIDRLLQNIKKRGRDYEQEISADYLEKIQNAYLNYFKNHHKKPYLILDVSDVDFVNNAEDFKKISSLIEDSNAPRNAVVRV
ncbi:MAG: deoxynucleoside kinase [Chitinophagales bacterium]